MYWYKFKDDSEKQQAVDRLSEIRYIESEWSAPAEDAVAIAIHNDGGPCRVYIMLNLKSIGTDPRTSWVHTRKECETLDEFIDSVKSIDLLTI